MSDDWAGLFRMFIKIGQANEWVGGHDWMTLHEFGVLGMGGL